MGSVGFVTDRKVKTKSETKSVTVRLPGDQANILKKVAENRRLNVTDIITEAIDQYIETAIPNICQSCKTVNQIDAKFCKNCGLPLNKEGLEDLNAARELVRKNPSLLFQLAQELERK
jgi:hypothetical protein